jgi:hypothetical protein
MLAIPTTGFARSVNEHNVRLDALCDWIEGSLLFSTERLSEPEVADILHENEYYSKKEFAHGRLSDAWTELRRRLGFLGRSSPYRFEGINIHLVADPWRDTPAHSFCVLLSMAKWHREWAARFGPDYTQQGELFEELTKEAVSVVFNTWQIHQTGWARERTTKLDAVVRRVASLLGETVGKIEKWTSDSTNEAGLDLLCWRSFPDGRGCYPTLLFQCASGRDWPDKLETPNLKVWRRLVEFRAMGFPTKAFSTPFAFLDDEFTRTCNRVDGLLMDRYRLLAAGFDKQDWLSVGLSKRIAKWAKPRAAKLPLLEE